MGNKNTQEKKQEDPQTFLEKGLNVGLNFLYENKWATDLAAKALKAVNIVGEKNIPTLTGQFAKQIMEWTDKHAYDIASQNADFIRRGVDLESNVPWNRQAYTGDIYGSDVLEMFLGMGEGNLPLSDYEPTSYTGPPPELGWRSMKSHGEELELEGVSESYYTDTHKKRETTREELKGYGSELNKLVESVKSGTYNPNDHAVKFSDYGDVKQRGHQLPGFDLGLDANTAHLTKSIGYDKDKKQYYFSVMDIWDFDPEQYAELYGRNEAEKKIAYTQSSLLQAAGKGVGLYDRFYLPEGFVEEWADFFEPKETEDKIINSMIGGDKSLFLEDEVY